MAYGQNASSCDALIRGSEIKLVLKMQISILETESSIKDLRK